MLITSLTNPRIKHIVALRDKKSQREADGLMLVEGFEEVSLALASGVQPKTLFFCPVLFRKDTDAALLERIRVGGAELIEVTQPVFEKMAYRDGPDGWLIVVIKPDFRLAQLPITHYQSPLLPLIVVAEAVEKPGNFGAMLRSCDAAGVDAFISCGSTTEVLADLSNPNVVRSSVGTYFSVPIAEASNDEALRWLRQNHIQIIATTPNPGPDGVLPMDYTHADLTQPIAILVGTEKFGLSEFWLRHADVRVRIPMLGRVNSLNVATSAALVIYEAVRQRAKH
jgi:TrmH family RNA methyltransferase